MKRALAFAFCVALVAGQAAAESAPEAAARPVVIPAPQDRTPLGIALPIGQERQVTFPAPVEVGMPAGLADTVRTQVVAGTVYWVAKSEFTPQRIQVRDTATGQIYLVDLSARSSASSAPVIVTQGAAPAQHTLPC